MSGIIRRTVYYYVKNDVTRFLDWATVTTGLGEMVEPFQANRRHTVNTNIIDWDPEDQIARIDGMERIDYNSHHLILGHGNAPLHGGVLVPRDGQ